MPCKSIGYHRAQLGPDVCTHQMCPKAHYLNRNRDVAVRSNDAGLPRYVQGCPTCHVHCTLYPMSHPLEDLDWHDCQQDSLKRMISLHF